MFLNLLASVSATVCVGLSSHSTANISSSGKTINLISLKQAIQPTAETFTWLVTEIANANLLLLSFLLLASLNRSQRNFLCTIFTKRRLDNLAQTCSLLFMLCSVALFSILVLLPLVLAPSLVSLLCVSARYVSMLLCHASILNLLSRPCKDFPCIQFELQDLKEKMKVGIVMVRMLTGFLISVGCNAWSTDGKICFL